MRRVQTQRAVGVTLFQETLGREKVRQDSKSCNPPPTRPTLRRSKPCPVWLQDLKGWQWVLGLELGVGGVRSRT